jgi:hypothetical protein
MGQKRIRLVTNTRKGFVSVSRHTFGLPILHYRWIELSTYRSITLQSNVLLSGKATGLFHKYLHEKAHKMKLKGGSRTDWKSIFVVELLHSREHKLKSVEQISEIF